MARDVSRRGFLKAVGLGAVGVGAAPRVAQVFAKPQAAPGRKPNVILVMTDDQGYGDLRCHGNPVIRTPHLDKLYARSVRLTDFHVAPCCTPTRAQLMVGQDAVRCGAWGTTWGRSMPRPELSTMADVFAAGGYRTGHFGKWHLGDSYPYRPEDRGFGEVLRHGGGGVGQAPDYWGNNYFDDTYLHNGAWKKFKGYCTDVWFDGAMRFIEANKDKPFFAYIPTNAPHGPYLVAEKYSKLYAGKKGVNAAFYGMIANIDENMGRLVEKLDELNLTENTILIFTTDNGTSGGHFGAGMSGRKGSTYEGGHRVPFFIHWPAGGMTGGRDMRELTHCQDLLPTFIGLCGLEKPEGAKFDGVDISPLLTGKVERLPERMLVVQYSQTTTPPKKYSAAVMYGRWRLVGAKALFDIHADPGQKTNVAAKHPDVVEKMLAHYEKWWADVSRRFGDMSHIVLGSDKANPTALSSFDWHTKTAWSQGQVRAGARVNSFWAVEVERDGRYEISLRRWPEEADQPITGPDGKGGKALPVASARIEIGDVEQAMPVGPEDVAATFKVQLKAGKTKLQTWLLDKAGKELCGAYYTYVKRLP